MPQCVAPGCKNVSGEDLTRSVSLHRFPFHKPELLKKWVENLGRKGYKLPSSARLCSVHFLPSCYKETAPGQPRRLKDDAVPTEFIHRETSPPHKTLRSPQQQDPGQFLRKSPRIMRRKTYSSSQSSQEKETVLQITPKPHSKQAKTVTFCSELETVDVDEPISTLPTISPSSTRKERTPRKEKPVTSTVTRSMLGLEVEDYPETAFLRPSDSPLTSARQVAVPVTAVQYGTPRRTRKDHAYSAGIFRAQSTQTDPQTPVKSPVKSPQEPLSSPMESGEEQTDIEEYAEYLPSSSVENSSSDSDSACKSNYCDMKKFVVFEENLLQLMKFCKDCGSAVISCTSFTRGSLVGYRISCLGGHSYVWNSQPLQHRQPVGNLLITAATLVTGSTYAKIKAFADMLKLQLISKSVYNKVQKGCVFPVIQECWLAEKEKVIEQLKEGGPVVLGGDARCDSPGHSAKYGSYTLMHTSGDRKPGSQQIVAMNLVQVTEVKNSNHMEPEGLERCLRDVTERGLTVDTLATDQHIMVTSNMKKHHKEISHQFDVWHLAKGVNKKISQAAKAKDCEDLGPWTQSVSNHLWWACATCGGDEQLLREKWLSVLHHVTNKHKWSGNTKFHQCAHNHPSGKDQKTTKWLKPTQPAFSALKKIVHATRLLNALTHVTKFCHTGELEVFHSMLLKYCPKRQHFHYDGMSARLMLAAMDWNQTKRKQEKEPLSGRPTSVVFSKKRKSFILKTRSKKVCTDHMMDIVKRVYVVHKDKVSLPQIPRPVDLPANVAPIPKPAKTVLESRFKSRFK